MTTIAEKPLARSHEEEHEDPRKQLMFDPLPRGVMNYMVMESMYVTSWKFWAVTALLVVLVITCLVICLGLHDHRRPGCWLV